MTTNIPYFSLAFLLMCIGIALLQAPVMAAAEYLGGEPVLVASLGGPNEYLPGSDAAITVVIENRGTPEFKLFPEGRVASDEQPSTAKLLRVGLEAGDAPIIIRTDPQMVGDLPANSRLEVPFQAKFLQNASGGGYTLPLSLQYQSLSFAEQRGYETMAYSYKSTSATIPLQVKVTPRVSIAVTKTQAGELTSGNEGFLTLTIRNNGSLSGNESVARILRHQESPLLPVAGTSYIGEFSPGKTVQARFRIQVGDEAQASTYPLDVVVEYLDPQGDLVTTGPVTIGVPVLGSIEFELLSNEFAMPRGGTSEIEILYRNTGPVTVRSAQARISAVDPFTAEKSTSSLGDLAPGEEARAVFVISVDKSATLKEYGLESEVRYRDALDNRLISDPIKVRVRVLERSGVDVILGNPLYMTILVAILIGIGYFAYTRRKKGQDKRD